MAAPPCAPWSQRSGAGFPALVELYDNTASLQDRTVATGRVAPELARQFAAGGYVGRASGRAFDARRTPGYPPYDLLGFEVPLLDEGDVDARVWVRIREVEQSLALIEQILARLPDGADRGSTVPARAGEGMALVEASAATSWSGCGSRADGRRRALPSARPVLVPVAAARGRDRGQHRRRFPALQQILQLLLLGPRSLGCMRRYLLLSLFRPPLTERARRRPATRRWPSSRAG